MRVTRKWKLLWWSGSKKNFMKQGYMLSFEPETLLLRETMTMLKSRDVIYREPVSFWCMIHVLMLIIIPVQKKKKDTWRNGYRRWFPKLLRRHSSGGCRFNPHYRWVTIQKYLTLIPGYRQMESEQVTPMNSMKDVILSSVKVPRVRQTPEKGRRTYRPKRCGNNKDDDNSPKTLNEKNDQASSEI